MKVLVIVNARSGGGDAGLYDFIRELGDDGTEIVLRFAGTATRLEDLVADASDFDRVVAAGGDGTASAIAYALCGSNVPLLVYPAGTANLLALNLGLPNDAPALAEIARHGVPVAFDLGEMTLTGDSAPSTSGFAIVAGAGYDASIIEGAQPLKATLGAGAYLAAAVSNLTPTAAEFELVLDGEHITTDGIAVLLVNFGRIQFDLPIAKGFSPCDGKLEVAVVRSKNIAGLIPAVLTAIGDLFGGQATSTPGIDVYSAAEIEVRADPPLRMQYDGEALDAYTPFTARCLPGAVTMIVPPGSAYDVDAC